MNVLFVTSTPFPTGMAATNRIRNYGLGLIENNIYPEVVVYHSTEKGDRQDYNKNSGIWEKIKYRYPYSSIRSKSFIKRRIDDIRDKIWTIRYIYSSDNEYVYIYMNSLFFEALSIFSAKLAKKKLLRELCEYPYHKKFFLSKLNLRLFKFYDGIIAISQKLENIAQIASKSNAKVLKVPILINSEELTSVRFINERPYIFHGGTLTEHKDAIVSTMKAFAIANKKLRGSVDFILAGPESTDVPLLKEIIVANNLQDNVKFIGLISADEIKKYQNGAALCILNKNDNLQNRCGFSTKLGEVLLSETAVITTTVGEANYWLRDGESAYITEPHKPELIADLIVRAFEDPQKREQIAKNGKDIALRNFDISVQGPRLADFISKL